MKPPVTSLAWGMLSQQDKFLAKQKNHMAAACDSYVSLQNFLKTHKKKQT